MSKPSLTKTMLSKTTLTTLLSLSFCFAQMNTQADVIKVPVGQQTASQSELTKPTQGMSKTAVKAQYGKPSDWKDAVGKPPISSWEYENFTVYFESEYVIQSVFKNKPVKEIRQSADENGDAM